MRLTYILLGFLVITQCVKAETGRFIEGVSDGRRANTAYETQACTLESGAVAATPGGLAPEKGNWGASGSLSLGCGWGRLYRSLLRFDVSALADRMVSIQGARLVLRFHYLNAISADEPIPEAIELRLYRIEAANAGWVEGDSALGERVEGAVCWAERASGQAGWAGEGGCGLAGTDRAGEPLASVILHTQGLMPGEEVIFEFEDPAFLESWVLDGAGNMGFVLEAPGLEGRPEDEMALLAFDSDDAAGAQGRPRLEIEYVSRVKESTYREGDDPPPSIPCQTRVTTLVESDGQGHGADPAVRAGCLEHEGTLVRCRGLLAFDVGDLAARVKMLDEVRLEMHLDAAGSALEGMDGPLELALFRLTDGNAGWVEGEAGLASGGAVWAGKTGIQTPWVGTVTAGGGVSAPDIDFVSTPVAVAEVDPASLADGQAVVFVFKSLDFLDAWMREPAANAGFKLECAALEEAAQNPDGFPSDHVLSFYSDDAVDPEMRPQLVVRYFKTENASAGPGWTLWE